LRPGLPVENGEAIDLHAAIKRRIVHKILLWIVLSEPDTSPEPAG
jgi:hypothetical protein